jgi:tRNA threonylcarbamoyladenosine biosynthesis protein TsaE
MPSPKNSKLHSRFSIQSKSSIETRKWGGRLAQFLKAGDVVLFVAPLGAGKTTFIQGLLKKLKVKNHVTSPTFILVQTYDGNPLVHHMDFYRVTCRELVAMGIDDYFLGQGAIQKGLVLVEWADRCKKLWPVERIQVEIKIPKLKNTRKILFSGRGKKYADIIKKIKNKYQK